MLTNLQDLDDNTGKISIVGFFEIKWRDNNLTWDPLLYDSVNLIILPNTQIWKPYLLLGNPYKNVAIISMTDSTINTFHKFENRKEKKIRQHHMTFRNYLQGANRQLHYCKL
jgi:hypothetical protein